MVNNNAIVYIVDRITEKNSAPCKKSLQKIVYLIEAKRVDIGCDYGIHFYGPYSSDLDFAVRELSDEGVLNIEYTPKKHLISVVDSSAGEKYSNDIVNEVVDEFASDSPGELELIATVLYVYREVRDISKVKAGVIKIKGNKYSEERIKSAINRLKRTGFIV